MSSQLQLIGAVQKYAQKKADLDGLVHTPVPGLRMMCVANSVGVVHSTYRPLICLILQGSKHMLVGDQDVVCNAGQAVVVVADMPVVGQVIRSSPTEPYVAIAIELDMILLKELVDLSLDSARVKQEGETLFLLNTDEVILDCSKRLVALIEHPVAIPILFPGLLKELHYWLLAGSNGDQLRAMATKESRVNKLSAAVSTLREQFRERIFTEYLADISAMGLTTFHKQFKALTSLTPGQYQKRLRLIEARRLMLYEGFNSSGAAFEVGYESVSQFSRDYRRMFLASPKQDVAASKNRRGAGFN